MSADPDSTADEVIVTAGGLSAQLIVEGEDWQPFEPLSTKVAAALAALAAEAPTARGTVTLLLTSDAHVRDLNRQFRGQDKPTNVLSFPAVNQRQPPFSAHAPEARADRSKMGAVPDLPLPSLPLGDIALAAETLAREAASLAIAPGHHFQHLVIHGVLHLLGHDHASEGEAEAMEAIEIRALARLGIANPYYDMATARSQS